MQQCTIKQETVSLLAVLKLPSWSTLAPVSWCNVASCGLSISNFLDSWKNFRLQYFFVNCRACSPVQTKPKASSPRSMLRRQTFWYRLGAWLLILCGVQRHHSQTLRRDHSVCWRQDPRWKFSYRNKWVLDSRDFWGHSTNGCSSLDARESLL